MINTFLGKRKAAEKLIIFANPCTMQIILSHFGDVSLSSQSKRVNAPIIERLTGVKDYDAKLYTSFEQLPLTLNADDIAAYLNISRGNAYTLLHREDFPTLRIGKRMIAPRDKFLAWLDQQMSA